jgi:16S rRNA (adenine1518-N6/adenine1519-N6)-dimethyltransferase
VFWPRPKIESTVIRLTRRNRPRGPVVGRGALFRVIDVAFGERRKTMTNALRRLGLGPAAAARALDDVGVPPAARAEEVSLEAFARIAQAIEGADRPEDP